MSDLRPIDLGSAILRGWSILHGANTIQEPLQGHLRKVLVNGVNHLEGGPCLVIEHATQRSFRNSSELREDFLSHVI